MKMSKKRSLCIYAYTEYLHMVSSGSLTIPPHKLILLTVFLVDCDRMVILSLHYVARSMPGNLHPKLLRSIPTISSYFIDKIIVAQKTAKRVLEVRTWAQTHQTLHRTAPIHFPGTSLSPIYLEGGI